MVDDEIDLRPILGGLADIIHAGEGQKMRELLRHLLREKPLMDTHSIYARLQQPFIERIKQLFIIHPPWVDGQMLVGIVANRIAFEAIGLELFDGTLHLLHPAWPTGCENGVGQHALGA